MMTAAAPMRNVCPGIFMAYIRVGARGPFRQALHLNV
jgi:hypothetical protein